MDAKTNAAAVEDVVPDFATTASDPPPVPEEPDFEHALSRPIQANGEETHILRWREPTAGDIERAGNPIILDFIDGKGRVEFNEKKMSAMISVLTVIPPSSVRQLTAGDWNAIAWKLVRHFMPQGAVN